MAAYRTEQSIDAYLLNLIRCFCAAFIVRASACTVNDIFDRKMDAGVGKLNILDLTHLKGQMVTICYRTHQEQTVG